MPKQIQDLTSFTNLLKTAPATKPANNRKKTIIRHKTGKVETVETVHPTNRFKNRLTIIKLDKVTKFKLRTAGRLFTFKAKDATQTKAISSVIPPGMEKNEIGKAKDKKKTGKK